MNRFFPVLFFALFSFLFAEPYVGVHGGYVFPMHLTSVQIAGTNFPPGTTSSPIPYRRAGLYGFTVGYFTQGISWLGIALYADVFKHNQKNQLLTVKTPVWGPIVATSSLVDSGTGSLRIVETDFLVLFRYPHRYAEPYGGVGVAILGAKRTLNTATAYGETIAYNASTNTVAPGLNVRAGIRFCKKYHAAPYVEWKLTWSELTFFPDGGAASSGVSGVKGTFLSNTVLAGLSYVF